MIRGNRPSIITLGRVTDDGMRIIVAGWELGLCAARCRCHQHPTTGQLTIAEDQTYGTLGLVQHHQCPCCQHWTHEELRQVLADLAAIAALQPPEPLSG